MNESVKLCVKRCKTATEFSFVYKELLLHSLDRETIGKEAVDRTCPYQVDSDSTSKQEAQVDVDGVILILNDPGQTTNDGTNNEGEDQQGLEQLG